MQQSRALQRFATGIALLLAIALGGCSNDSPEQAVRQRIDALQAAIDARDAGDIQALLAEDFVGNDGIDKRGAQQLAAAVFLRHRQVAAKVGPVSVELRGQADAIARFGVLATGGAGGLLPEQGQLYQVETGWRLVDGDWQLLNASWTPAGR